MLILPPNFESKIGSKGPENRQKPNPLTVSYMIPIQKHLVHLPCGAIDDLHWKQVVDNITPDQQILWALDLRLDAPYFPLEEELRFHSLRLALSLFTKEIWPVFQERTIGAILFQGSLDFSPFFHWSCKQEENWKSWKEGRALASEPYLHRLFCLDAFIHYFQMLAHALPDEMPLYLLFEGTGCGGKAETFQLLSRDGLEYFKVAVKGVPGWEGLVWQEGQIVSVNNTASLAICLPTEAQCSAEILAKLDRLLPSLSTPYRIIPEGSLIERLEGVDSLYVFSDSLTVQGKRQLRGFCATGGKVIVDGSALGLAEELPAEKFRGRGI
ncbi:MAG: hypothetical protein HY861_03100 [Chlamydiia bacterium]|nr:hypothetical protein [Chlamydiia bacterium]